MWKYNIFFFRCPIHCTLCMCYLSSFWFVRDTHNFIQFSCENFRHTKENSTHKRTFHVWMYLYPNICMDTAGITRDSCMTSVKNNIFRLLSPIMRRKENSDCQSTCTIIHCTFNIHIKVTKVNKYTYKRRNSSPFSVGIDPSNIRFV